MLRYSITYFLPKLKSLLVEYRLKVALFYGKDKANEHTDNDGKIVSLKVPMSYWPWKTIADAPFYGCVGRGRKFLQNHKTVEYRIRW